MNKRVWKIGATAWCSSLLLLAGCSSSVTDDVAGSSMETENSVAENTIAVAVRASNGMPAAHMKVQVRPNGFLAGAGSFDTTEFVNVETDSNGVASFETMNVGSYTIEALDDSLKGFKKIEITEADTGLIEMPLQVQKPGSLKGQVLIPEDTGPVTVSLYGLDYTVQTDSLGVFEFASLPEGEHKVVAFIYTDSTFTDENGWESHVNGMRTIAIKTAEVVSKKASKLELGTPEPTYVMFEDFEGSVTAWYPSESQYATATLSFEKDVDGREGIVAHLSSVNDSALNWALMGYEFDKPVDFSDLDSIVFWAKGTSHMSVAFDVNADSTSEYETGKAWAPLELDSVWTRYTITPDDMVDSSNTNGGNLGWNAVKTHVTNLSFFNGPDTSEFWIDDIEIYGVKKSRLK